MDKYVGKSPYSLPSYIHNASFLKRRFVIHIVTQQICLLVSAPWLYEYCLAIGILPIASIGHMTGCELAIFHSTRNLQPLNIYGLQFIISFIFITIWILVFGTIRFDLIETVSEIMPIYFCCIFLSSQCFDCYAWPEAISAQSSDP